MEKNSTITAIIANCLKGMFPAPLGTFGFRIITILFVLLSFLPFAPITDSLETIQQLEISRKYATLTPVIFAIYSLVTIVVFALFVIRILSDINGYGVYEKDQIFTSGTLISVYLFFFLQIASGIFGAPSGICDYVTSMFEEYSIWQLAPFVIGWFLMGLFAMILVVEIFTDKFPN